MGSLRLEAVHLDPSSPQGVVEPHTGYAVYAATGLRAMRDTRNAGYREMAADSEREAEATTWCNKLAGDMADEARSLSPPDQTAPETHSDR